MGVKQGCPLSPTLFGLYIDDIEGIIMRKLDLFDALVNPVLSYASDVWATQYLLGSCNPCERIHRSFLRGILGEHLVQAVAISQKSKVQLYNSCVRGGLQLSSYQPAEYLSAVADRPRRVRMAQLRTGSHWLRVETGRWQRLEREQRVCPHCEAAAVEDERHMVFDCPTYAGLRLQFPALFSSGGRSLGC
ncbi:hypothetical protein N2152v2_001070 [Parachlorella kessleri]